MILTDLLPEEAEIGWYELQTWIETGFNDAQTWAVGMAPQQDESPGSHRPGLLILGESLDQLASGSAHQPSRPIATEN